MAEAEAAPLEAEMPPPPEPVPAEDGADVEEALLKTSGGEDAFVYKGQLGLLRAMRARKEAEEHAAKLANRVAQLKKKEAESDKIIQKTRQKADEIVQIRARNAAEKKQREMRKAEIEATIQEQCSEFAQARRENERKRAEAAERSAAEKRSQMLGAKEEHRKNQRYLTEQRLLDRKNALDHKKAVKQAQDDMRAKMTQKDMAKLQLVHEENQKRLKEELKLQAKHELELKQLAKLEKELIERLQQKMEEQKRAVKDLESALQVQPAGPGSTAKAPASAPAEGAEDEPDEAEVAKKFGALDANGTGTIPKEAVGELMKSLGFALNPPQLAQAQSQLSPDGGPISFGAFLLWWRG